MQFQLFFALRGEGKAFRISGGRLLIEAKHPGFCLIEWGKGGAQKILHRERRIDFRILVQIADGSVRLPDNLPAVRHNLPGADFDEGAFPGAVLAHNPHVFAFVQGQPGILIQEGVAKGVGQMCDFQ